MPNTARKRLKKVIASDNPKMTERQVAVRAARDLGLAGKNFKPGGKAVQTRPRDLAPDGAVRQSARTPVSAPGAETKARKRTVGEKGQANFMRGLTTEPQTVIQATRRGIREKHPDLPGRKVRRRAAKQSAAASRMLAKRRTK